MLCFFLLIWKMECIKKLLLSQVDWMILVSLICLFYIIMNMMAESPIYDKPKVKLTSVESPVVLLQLPFFSFCLKWLIIILRKAYSEPCQTSKVEYSEKIKLFNFCRTLHLRYLTVIWMQLCMRLVHVTLGIILQSSNVLVDKCIPQKLLTLFFLLHKISTIRVAK